MGDPRQDLHQGVFVFGAPIGWPGWVAMGIGLLMLAIAVPTFVMAGTLVDAPSSGGGPGGCRPRRGTT